MPFNRRVEKMTETRYIQQYDITPEEGEEIFSLEQINELVNNIRERLHSENILGTIQVNGFDNHDVSLFHSDRYVIDGDPIHLEDMTRVAIDSYMSNNVILDHMDRHLISSVHIVITQQL